jgi:hypothetical protein
MPGNVITENGWRECERSDCETLLVPGTEARPVRVELHEGDVATILTAWAAWFHRNVRPINDEPFRNWWGWSENNDVWNSNHLSGTAEDLCSNQLPWQRYTMPQNQVEVTERGLALFEGTVFWGRRWNRVDEMHFQIGLPPSSPKIREFADRLRGGYLNIFGPPDPKAFPLPAGYYYGPLEGPIESVSGEHESDSQWAKDGLGRWQEALGLPVTKKWNDGQTPKAATTLQLAKGWPPNPLFGYGGVYEGEWNAVIKEGWRLPEGWDPAKVADPEPSLTKWGDYSQHQAAYVNDSYPYKAIAFRASIADEADEKFLKNMRIAKEMVANGKLEKIIAYHFWVPGRDNWGTFQRQLEASGGVFPELAFMLDVEDGGNKWNIRGDQTPGVKDFIKKGQEYFGNTQAASIYTNFTANPDLLLGYNDIELRGVKLIVPRYYGTDRPPATPPGVSWFGHQYSDREDTPPFGPTDINMSPIPLSVWLDAWGVNRAAADQPEDQPDQSLEQLLAASGSDNKIWEALERIAAKSHVDLTDIRPANGYPRRPVKSGR